MTTTPRTVDGADLSHHQEEVSLGPAVRAGLKFLYHKATEGTSYVDPKYAARRRAARLAKVPFGAYHFARPDRSNVTEDAHSEAMAFLAAAAPEPGDLIPALDLEVDGGLSHDQLKAWAQTFSATVKQHVGVLPVLYSPWDLGLPNIRWVPRYNNTNTPPVVPWDIWQFSNGQYGIPNSHPGLGHVDLNTFRDGFNLRKLLIPAPSAPHNTDRVGTLRHAHLSLEYKDSDEQTRSDVKKIFSRGYDFITGTEAGPGAGGTAKILRDEGAKAGYRVWKPQGNTDGWIAVRKDLVKANWENYYTPVVPPSDELKAKGVHLTARFGEKGIVAVEFDTEEFGHIGIATTHYLTEARNPDSPQWPWNKKLGHALGDWAKDTGRGSAIVFTGADSNMADNKTDERGDTFFGRPLTSAWDELQRYENTGHGTIDVTASYDRDGRVRAKRVRALDDSELHLNTDHFLVETVWEVTLLG